MKNIYLLTIIFLLSFGCKNSDKEALMSYVKNDFYSFATHEQELINSFDLFRKLVKNDAPTPKIIETSQGIIYKCQAFIKTLKNYRPQNNEISTIHEIIIATTNTRCDGMAEILLANKEGNMTLLRSGITKINQAELHTEEYIAAITKAGKKHNIDNIFNDTQK